MFLFPAFQAAAFYSFLIQETVSAPQQQSLKRAKSVRFVVNGQRLSLRLPAGGGGIFGGVWANHRSPPSPSLHKPIGLKWIWRVLIIDLSSHVRCVFTEKRAVDDGVLSVCVLVLCLSLIPRWAVSPRAPSVLWKLFSSFPLLFLNIVSLKHVSDLLAEHFLFLAVRR